MSIPKAMRCNYHPATASLLGASDLLAARKGLSVVCGADHHDAVLAAINGGLATIFA
ncbi:MAG: hypothetical protein AAFY06_11100 [Pseudomonadota bacterium]